MAKLLHEKVEYSNLPSYTVTTTTQLHGIFFKIPDVTVTTKLNSFTVTFGHYIKILVLC
jgi:hypothetical protein